jgi:hypothetical protein
MGKTKRFTQTVDVGGSIAYQQTLSFGPGQSFSQEGTLWRNDANIACVSDITYGDNYRNWEFLMREGYDATTTMQGTIRRLTRKTGHLDGQVSYHLIAYPPFRVDWSYQGSGIFSSESAFSSTSIPSSSATAENRALVRFNAKAAGVNRQFQGGVFFAELHKALHGIRHPAEALFKGIETYSRAATKLRTRLVKSRAHYRSLGKAQQRQVAKSFTEAATGLWLEKTFHWLPLMYDIQGAFSALEHSFDRLPSVFVKVSANDVQQETASTVTGGLSFISLNYSISEKAGASARMYGRVRVQSRLPYWPDSAALGFDPRSFVPTIWELIPYSWAIDYFTNIGDVLYGMSQGGCDVTWAALGTKRYVKRTLLSSPSFNGIAPSGYVFDNAFLVASPSEWSSEKAIINRASYSGNFIPDLEWKVPGISLKWLNLGAAFLQRSLAFL